MAVQLREAAERFVAPLVSVMPKRWRAAVVPVVRLSGVIGAVTPLRPGLSLAAIARTLERAFAFPNFVDALAFTNKVSALAESESHHPALLTEWGKVTVTWWTHKIGGLHRNDFIMAAKTDQLYAGK